MTSLYWDELQGAQFMNDFPILILIRWKLDFKCNFIVGNHIAKSGNSNEELQDDNA